MIYDIINFNLCNGVVILISFLSYARSRRFTFNQPESELQNITQFVFIFCPRFIIICRNRILHLHGNPPLRGREKMRHPKIDSYMFLSMWNIFECICNISANNARSSSLISSKWTRKLGPLFCGFDQCKLVLILCIRLLVV